MEATPRPPGTGRRCNELEIAACGGNRAFFIKSGALLAQKVDGHTVVNGDHVVDAGQDVQVVRVVDVIDGHGLVPMNRVVVHLTSTGKAKAQTLLPRSMLL